MGLDMGLDMYLVKIRNKDGERFGVMYWRKANQIYRWFKENVEQHNGDGDSFDVPFEKLKELLETIKEVLKERDEVTARLLLPTQEGFFFGSTDYGEGYWDDLENTKEVLEKELFEAHFQEPCTYNFYASW